MRDWSTLKRLIWLKRTALSGGRTIFDEALADWKPGYTISASGVESSNAGYKYSQYFFPCEENTSYAVSIHKGVTTSAGTLLVFYDAEKSFISRESAIAGSSATGDLSGQVTSPAGAAYFHVIAPKTNTTNVKVVKQ